MKTAFYPRLALEGIVKNRKLYLPYLLTCVLMVAMFYIEAYLSDMSVLEALGCSPSTQIIMAMGTVVLGVFSAVFLFYTNSFLMRRRKKEFGLYNILGMGKRSIGRILLWETLFSAAGSLMVGLGIGVAFSKLAELALVNLVDANVELIFIISRDAVKYTLITFPIIFLLVYLNALRQVRFSTAIALMRSEDMGEKPPRNRWLLGILGVILLVVAYAIAVTIKDPISAILYFFIAVIMVIVATYLLFIAGSVLLCRLLQKNPGYYYQKSHFVSVSSMTYRMKRNGAGLASICILLTMIFVMISSTTCLYFGAEDSIKSRYPHEICLEVRFNHIGDTTAERITSLRSTAEDIAAQHGAKCTDCWSYRDASVSGLLDKNGNLIIDASRAEIQDFSKLLTVHFIPVEDYCTVTGRDVRLSQGQVLAYGMKLRQIPDTLHLNGISLEIVERIDDLVVENNFSPTLFLIISDYDATLAPLADLLDDAGDIMLIPRWIYGFSSGLPVEEQGALADDIGDAVMDIISNDTENACYSYFYTARETMRDDFYGSYGGLFFLGVILSVVFLVAAVLIIYYKQISEGYEDHSRFAIMQKVGMTKQDIRESINSQMLTVFFLPLGFAVLHLAFAFPMIRKLLVLFSVENMSLLLLTTGISILLFGIVYLIIYRVTSNAYYTIVSTRET